MKKIGLTGGIGSGKSTVARVFGILGIPVYHADDRARELMNQDKLLRKIIMEEFGQKSYVNDQLDRNYLAGQIFGNASRIELLNNIVHPAVRRDFENWTSKLNSSYVLQEAALLVDNGAYRLFDKLITVSAPRDLRIQRVEKRDPTRSREQINQIIERQVTEQARQDAAHYIINNDEKDLLIPQILDIHQRIMTSWKRQ